MLSVNGIHNTDAYMLGLQKKPYRVQCDNSVTLNYFKKKANKQTNKHSKIKKKKKKKTQKTTICI